MALQETLRAARAGPATSPRPHRRRWDLVAAWAVLLLPALALLGVLAARQRVGDLEDRLVREVNGLVGQRQPRPVHVASPRPGAVGELARPHLRPLAEVARRLQGDLGLLREVVDGTAKVGGLSPATQAALEDARPHLDGLLAATHAERADLDDPYGQLGKDDWHATWQTAAVLTGVRVRQALASGDSRRALADGLDGLALGRDAAIGGGLLGRMVDAAIVKRLTPVVCDAAVALPGADDRRATLAGLRAIRRATPPFSATLRAELIWTNVAVGPALPASVRARLDPRALPALDGPAREATWWTRLLFRDGWRGLRKVQDELVAAADLPGAERDAAWRAVQARGERQANPLAAIALPDYGRYARRADAADRRLDALVLAAAAATFREAQGRWPATVGELAAAGLLAPEEAARLADAGLEPEEGALDLVVPLPQATAEEPTELELVLRGG